MTAFSSQARVFSSTCSSMTPEAATPVEPVRKSLLWLVAVGFFMQTLDATIINTALPAMAASLGESPLRMQSVIVAYALTMAMLGSRNVMEVDSDLLG